MLKSERHTLDQIMELAAENLTREGMRHLAWEALSFAEGTNSPWRNPFSSPKNYRDFNASSNYIVEMSTRSEVDACASDSDAEAVGVRFISKNGWASFDTSIMNESR